MLITLKRIHETAREIASREHASTMLIFSDILWCWLHYGVTREDYAIFDFALRSGLSRSKIVGYRKYLQLEKWFNISEARELVDNKRGFLKNYGEFLGREWLTLADATESQARAFFERHARVIQKPEDSEQGRGIRRWESADVLANPSLFSEVFTRGGILEECLVQHPEMSRINDKCVNTIRVNSVVDGSGKVEIFSAVIIAGASDAPINHLHAGGVMYPVDLKTGRVYAWGLNFRREKFYEHPSTGIFMPGFQVPMWKEVLEMVERAALKIPQARLIGWDVALTPERPVLIEANFRAGNTTYQWWDKGGAWKFLSSKR